MDIGRAVKDARGLRGLTQKDLASGAGLDPSYVSLIERGRRVPSLDVVQRIASTVGLSVHTLVLLACDDADFKDAEDRASALKLLERVGVEGRQAS